MRPRHEPRADVYTVIHFTPSAKQLDDYFKLDKWLKEYEEEAAERLSGLYESYTAFMYEDQGGRTMMAAGVEWRALKAIEIKQRLEKVREKVAAKQEILTMCMYDLNSQERLVLWTYYQTGEMMVSFNILHQIKKKLCASMGLYLYMEYQDEQERIREKRTKRVREFYNVP